MKKYLRLGSAILLLILGTQYTCLAQLAFASNQQKSRADIAYSTTASHPLSIFNEIITGKVTDEKGEPLVGASVVLEGTTKGAITDFDGKYELTLTDAEKKGTLIISFVGFEKQKLPINGRTSCHRLSNHRSILVKRLVKTAKLTRKLVLTTAVLSANTA